MSVKGLWWLCFCFAFECWNPREVEKWGDILRQHRGRAEKKTSESFWKEIEIILIFYYLHFSLLETSWIENKLQFLSFVRNEPGQGTVEPKQAETLRSVWKKKTMNFLGGRDLSFWLPSNHIRWNATDLQQEVFSIWCKCSRGNPRGHTFSSVNCTQAIFAIKKYKQRVKKN